MHAQPNRHQSRRALQQAKGDKRETALVETAEELLAAGQYWQAPVGQLAERAGISRAAFYFYFASKEALLAHVLDRALAGFNQEISTVLEPREGVDAATALIESVAAAGALWWHNSPVLIASVELAMRMPSVYDGMQENLDAVRGPTVALLRREGRVPEADDPDEANALVLALTLLSERNFYHLMRGVPSEADLARTVDRIARIWLRSFGLA